jgi:hypothetical protein
MAMVFIALPVVAAAQGEGKKGTIDFCKTDKTYSGGIHIAVGDLTSDAPEINRIYVSRISLLTGTFDGGVGVVNSCDADAASKIRMLFDVRRNLRLTNDIAIEIPENNTPEWFQATNYLRQAQASGTRIPVMKLVVADRRSQQGYLKVELKEVYITSYQTGAAASVPTDQFSLNFGAIKFEYKPNDDKDKE